MNHETRIVVRVPGLSKTMLSEVLGGLQYQDERIKVVPNQSDSGLAVDPSTVTLASLAAMAAGEVVKEIVKAAVGAFVDWLKARRKKEATPVRARVVVALTLGGQQVAVIADPSELSTALPNLPPEAGEIAFITLTEAP